MKLPSVGAASVLVAALIGPVAPPAGAVTERVTLADMRFNPARLEVEIGDTVVWVAGDDDHTVTARDGTFDSSPRGLMGQGDEFRWRFRVPGDYPYFCRVHGARGMQGDIVVVDPSAPATTTTRPVQATAAATTSSTAAATTTTAAPTTTTSRPLATSSTTSVQMATPSTAPVGDPAVPQEAPTLNPAAPVLGSPAPEAGVPASEAASRRSGRSAVAPAAAAAGGFGLLLVLGVAMRRGLRGRRR